MKLKEATSCLLSPLYKLRKPFQEPKNFLENVFHTLPLIPLSIPFHLSAPEDVFLVIHVDWEVLVFALLDGVRASGDGSQLIELKHKPHAHVSHAPSVNTPNHSTRINVSNSLRNLTCCTRTIERRIRPTAPSSGQL